MRFVAVLSLLAVLAPVGLAQEEEKPKLNEDLVKQVRAMVSAKREKDRDELKAAILAREDLDWPSVKQGLMKGRYYQKPLVTAYGERHSGKHLGVRLPGKNGQERGFSFFVPKDYDAEKPLPLLVYLHHGSRAEHLGRGMDAAAVAVTKFKKIADDYGFFFVAPYTNKGAEWWTEGGEKLVAWSIAQLKKHYNIDENRIGLIGALDGGDAVWYLGQAMPGTFSVLMPMTGDPYEISGMVRPLCLGTLDRMDILMGIPGKTKSTVGEKNIMQFFDGLKPMFDHNMRITTAVFPRSDGDFHYLEKIEDQIANFVVEHKREPLAVEVDIGTTLADGQRALWLANHGYDKDGDATNRLPARILQWEPKLPGEPQKKLGLALANRPKWDIGVVVNQASGAAQENNLFPRDVVLEVDGQPVKDIKDIGPLVQKHEWKDEVHLVLAREVKEDDLEREQRNQKIYMKVRAKIEELRKAGKKIPSQRDLRSIVLAEEDDAASDDEDEDEDVEIEIGNGNGNGAKQPGVGNGKFERAKTVIFVFERWLTLRKPGVPLVYRGFGLGQDNNHEYGGVRIGAVYPGSLADRAGFKPGDVIKQIGDTEVKNSHDIQKWLKSTDFKFAKAPDGENWVDFTVQAFNNNKWGPERTVRVTWKPAHVTRVDARWDKATDTCNVMVRHCKGFTLYLTDELMPAGKDFHLYINDVPYQDLVNPAAAPKYPRMGPFMDSDAGHRVSLMRDKRARVPGWKPDYKLAIEDFLANQDRELVIGAKFEVDLSKLHEGFAAAKKNSPHGERPDKGARIKKAYEEYRSRG